MSDLSIIASLANELLQALKSINNRLGTIDDRLSALQTQLGKVETMALQEFTELQAQVEKSTTVEGSALALIQGIAAQLEAARNDPVALAEMASRLRNSADALAAAVDANTTPTAVA